MKLTVAEIHELTVGLSVIDQDEKVKLTGAVRLKLAINLNALRPIAAAYETARAKAYGDCLAKHPDAEVERPIIEGEFSTENHALRQVEHDVNLTTMTAAELDLDENTRITTNTLSRLVPIISY